MPKREFLHLAHSFNAKKHHIAGWFMSEKMDGERFLWDGGISRGLLKSEVPWANLEGDKRYIVPQVSTGLWTRYGNVIHAPDWWLDTLPKVMLGGELFINRTWKRQILRKIISPIKPGPGWKKVRAFVFELPPPYLIFRDGFIDTIHYKKEFINILKWLDQRKKKLDYIPPNDLRFESALHLLENKILVPGFCELHRQVRLPFNTTLAIKIVESNLKKITDLKGEGLILRNHNTPYETNRSHDLLKYKFEDDMEGTVIGYTTGVGKLLGLMGTLILDIGANRIIKLSGFTDEERVLTDPDWARKNPGEECPDSVYNPKFLVGMIISFKYRGLSNENIPQEAHYWRHR